METETYISMDGYNATKNYLKRKIMYGYKIQCQINIITKEKTQISVYNKGNFRNRYNSGNGYKSCQILTNSRGSLSDDISLHGLRFRNTGYGCF